MPPWISSRSVRSARPTVLLLLALAIIVAAPPRAFALITGGEGNKPLRDPGWPNGAAAIFNLMEDVATAEIARSQLWQWILNRASLSDGRPVTRELYAAVREEELFRLIHRHDEDGPAGKFFAENAAGVGACVDEHSQKWRDAGRLPFPDHAAAEISEFSNSMPYPPHESAVRSKKQDSQ